MAYDLVARLRLVDDLSRPLRRATSSIAGFGLKVSGVGAALAGLAAGVSAVAIASNSLKKAMSFESQMSTIAALTGATADEMARMQALALKMGASTKYSALEAAQGIEELLKAGLTPAAVQAGGLEAALNLATAGGLELADAAEIMSTALNAYKGDAMTAAQASNILAGTANASATSVQELRYSLAAVSAVAAGVGLSFEDTNIALGLFANNGLKGSDAGTSLKTMLSNLQPTTKAQVTLFKKLGLMTANGANAFYDAEGNIKSLDDISGTLNKSLSKLTNQQRSLTLEMIFGSDAVRAGNILYKEGSDGVANFRKEMSKVTALDVAKKKMDNAAGAVEQFKGALETLQIAALLPTMPIIKDFATEAADAVEKYTPQIQAAMEKSMGKLREFINANYLQNDEFMALNFADKVKVVAADVKAVFDTWWSSSGKAMFTAVSDNITSTLLASLENSVPVITEIGLRIGTGLVSGMWQGMKDSKALGWFIKFADGQYVKDAYKAMGVDIDAIVSNGDSKSKATGSAGILTKPAFPTSAPKSFAEDRQMRIDNATRNVLNGLPRNYNATSAPTQKAGVNVNVGSMVVREDADVNRVANELYRLIDGADKAAGGAR